MLHCDVLITGKIQNSTKLNSRTSGLKLPVGKLYYAFVIITFHVRRKETISWRTTYPNFVYTRNWIPLHVLNQNSSEHNKGEPSHKMFDFVQSKLLGCGNKLQINFQLPTLLKKRGVCQINCRQYQLLNFLCQNL